jgi:hypothetical protein
MIVSTAKIETTYRKVKHIREHMKAYRLAADRAKLSIEDLRWCISDMYSVKIEMREVAFEGEHLRGLVERYEGRARILIRAGQGDEWMRFTAVKELCHIAIDEKEDWSPRGHETIQNLLLEDQLDNQDAEKQKARKMAHATAQWEKLAVIAAIELMYPHEFREDDLKNVAEQRTTQKALALHFHVPEYVIGSALHPGRMEFARIGWEMANSDAVVAVKAAAPKARRRRG